MENNKINPVKIPVGIIPEELEKLQQEVNNMKHGTIQKLEDLRFNGKHPNGIDVGYVRTGLFHTFPTVGERFEIADLRTSKVTEIEALLDDEVMFLTENSSYKLTILE